VWQVQSEKAQAVKGACMRVLIVENDAELGQFWARFLTARGLEVELATSQRDAVAAMRFKTFDALVLELILPDGGAIALADFATYRFPDITIVTVTSTNFFSDGSIFNLIPNARGMMRQPVCPGDLAEILCHYSDNRTELSA